MSALSIAGLREWSYAGVVTTGSMMVLAVDGVRAAASDIVARRSREECLFQAWIMLRVWLLPTIWWRSRSAWCAARASAAVPLTTHP